MKPATSTRTSSDEEYEMIASRRNSDGYVEVPSDNVDSNVAATTESHKAIGQAINTSNAAVEPPPMRPRSNSEPVLPSNRQSTDLEAGAADTTNSQETPQGSLAGDIAIFLATMLIVIPGLVYIGLPSFFIITGQRHRMAVHFWWVYWLLVGIAYGVYPAVLSASRKENDTRREMQLRACGHMALRLGWLAGFGFSLRVIWWILTGIWWLVSGVVIAIWGGAPILGEVKGAQ